MTRSETDRDIDALYRAWGEAYQLAFEWGWDVQTVRPKNGGEARNQRQRVAVVLMRGDDGRWRFARGMVQGGPAS